MARWKLRVLQVALLQKSMERVAAGGRKITHAEIAEATGVPVSTVSAYISGVVENPSLDKLAPIAAYLGLSVKSLIDEGEDLSDQGNQNRSQLVPADAVPVA